MSYDPTFEEQQLLADTIQHRRTRMSPREMFAGLLADVGLLATCVGLALACGIGSFQLLPALLSMLVLVIASRVSFDTPFGFTSLTQVAFVPLLFALPAPLVPPAVAIALVLGRLPEALAGRVAPIRLLAAVGNSWFAVGPALVFAVSGTPAEHAGAGLLILALLAEFAADFTVSCLRFAIARGAGLAMQLRETWVYVIDAALSGVGLVIAQNVRSEPAVVLAVVPLLGLFGVLARERRRRLESLLELNRAYHGTALVLGDVIEADDGYTGEHCKSVVALAVEVGEAMGLNANQLRNLEFAALLHDVGKISLPKEIVNKPGPLDAREWELVKAHTIEGQRMLQRVGGFMQEVGQVVRSHHERWDGGGYPDGLAGTQIPLEARIITCCDSWNAMRTDRSYRAALAHDVAMTELLACTGTQFDPEVVAALQPIVSEEEGDAQALVARGARRSKLLSGLAQPAVGQQS